MRFRCQTSDQLDTCFRRLSAAIPAEGWLLDAEPFRQPHSDGQRALLWITWGQIAEQVRANTGQEWNANIVHDKVLGAVYGFREITLAWLGVDGDVYTEVCAKPLKTMTTAAGKPRRMSKAEMSEVIEATNKFAAEHVVEARMMAA